MDSVLVEALVDAAVVDAVVADVVADDYSGPVPPRCSLPAALQWFQAYARFLYIVTLLLTFFFLRHSIILIRFTSTMSVSFASILQPEYQTILVETT